MPDVTGPVSRFVADIDFENRVVALDATISKSPDADLEIAIWRLGDGTVIKSENTEINENQSFTYTFDKPGTYQISYSIIDTNDLSDKAFCSITFETEQNEENTLNNTGYLSYNNGTDCGKSYASYNNSGGIYALNESRSDIREALMYAGGGVGLLAGAVFFNITWFVLKRRNK